MESYEEQDYSVKSAIFGRDEEEENKETTFGAVGAMVLAIACCSRGIILQAFLTQKWRVHVFLVLNFLLLSIFVVSKRRYHGGGPRVVEDLEVEVIGEEEKEEEEEMVIGFEGTNGGDDVKVMCDGPKLSNDELNRRVEAFISMFRQQLILDARNGGNP